MNMSIRSWLKQIGVDYVMKEIEKVQIPEFETSDICRIKVTFKGRVQKVCFRLEMREIANKLNLTGYSKNLEKGVVVSEIQGEKDKVEFLVSHMHNIKRIKIKEEIRETINVINNEREFLRL